jgi:hypothetical protein
MLPRLLMTIDGAFLSLHSDGLAITIPTDLSDQDRLATVRLVAFVSIR